MNASVEDLCRSIGDDSLSPLVCADNNELDASRDVLLAVSASSDPPSVPDEFFYSAAYISASPFES